MPCTIFSCFFFGYKDKKNYLSLSIFCQKSPFLPQNAWFFFLKSKNEVPEIFLKSNILCTKILGTVKFFLKSNMLKSKIHCTKDFLATSASNGSLHKKYIKTSDQKMLISDFQSQFSTSNFIRTFLFSFHLKIWIHVFDIFDCLIQTHVDPRTHCGACLPAHLTRLSWICLGYSLRRPGIEILNHVWINGNNIP